MYVFAMAQFAYFLITSVRVCFDNLIFLYIYSGSINRICFFVYIIILGLI